MSVSRNQRDYKTSTARDIDKRNRAIFKRMAQSTVLVVTTVSAIGSFTTFGVTWVAIFVSAFALVLIFSLSANALLVYDSRNRKKGARHLVFLTPSSGGQSFYATMLVCLARNAARALGQQYVVVPSIPTESFESLSIWTQFAGLEDRHLEIDGIFFIPDQPDRHFDELVRFHEERDVPLVLVDVYFDLASCDERTRTRLPSFVGGDERAGGAAAASIIIDSIKESASDSPVVMIINGGVAPWEKQRADALRECLKAAWPLVRFIETLPINYERLIAHEITLRIIRSIADPARRVMLDAIFACNDDMAIGARSAISRLLREKYTFHTPPQIVGYDGVPEILEYIEEGDPHIAGTVDVRIDDQARAAMLLMHKLVRTKQRKSEVHLIVPEQVRRRSATVKGG
jgi:ABC-type sugar transport system substrate-binding protein